MEIELRLIRFVEIIKTLVYKQSPEIIEKVDYENDDAFLEPLLFSYFNSKKNDEFPKESLEEILQGYFIKKEKIKLKYSFNKNDVAYVPKVGYFKKGESVPFENIKLIFNTRIELIKHKMIHLKYVFRDFSENIIDEDLIEISSTLNNQFIKKLENAFSYIKKYCPDHYKLIEQCCKKVMLFKTNPENTNSFATIKAHGMAFFNVYQDDNDEVFFVDDIAHQTGHIILTTLLFERKKYFLIDKNQNLSSILNDDKEYRSFYILFHALYTYYTTLLCLDNCIESNCFNQKQNHEAKARIGFYLKKYNSDLRKLYKIANYYGGFTKILSKNAIPVFKIVNNKYLNMEEKWKTIVKKFNYDNQPYNFTYKKFIKLNPLKN